MVIGPLVPENSDAGYSCCIRTWLVLSHSRFNVTQITAFPMLLALLLGTANSGAKVILGGQSWDRDVLDANGETLKPVWILEIGCYTNGLFHADGLPKPTVNVFAIRPSGK